MSAAQPDQNTKSRSWSDLGPRLVSAGVLLVITASALYFGGIWFALVVGAVFATAYREWEIMIAGRQPDTIGMSLIALVALSAIGYVFYGLIGSAVVSGIGVIIALASPSNSRWWRAGGIIYLSAVIYAVLSLRAGSTTGIMAGLFLATSVWMTDSAAFFTGRQVGGIKLSPDISPSKTWSGAIGGLAFGAAGGLVVWLIATSSPWWIGLLIATTLSISGQIGDLAESAIKRKFRVKDSSDMIPGHGGFMDRLDSLASASLVCFAIGFFHSGIGDIAGGVLHW